MIHLLRQWEEKCVCVVEGRVPPLGKVVRRYQRLLRYLTAGGTAATVDIGALYVFTHFFSINYLVSSIFAFLIAFGVSFTLQKFWTFQDQSTDNVHAQATLYFVVAGINLFLNTLLMYFFVDILHRHYLVAQMLSSGLIACESFFISRILFSRRVVTGKS